MTVREVNAGGLISLSYAMIILDCIEILAGDGGALNKARGAFWETFGSPFEMDSLFGAAEGSQKRSLGEPRILRQIRLLDTIRHIEGTAGFFVKMIAFASVDETACC